MHDAEGRLSDEKLRQVAAHERVKMLEIKLSQGAKPGNGGILPGAKVTEEIAAIRGIVSWRDSISPNRRPEVASAGSLLDPIERVRSVTGRPVGVKSVIGAEAWLDELFSEILARGPRSAPDFMTIDSSDGGSGAAPMSPIDHVGLPIRESPPLVVDKLAEYGLRSRIRLGASGKLITPGEEAWALCVGADWASSARGFIFALGCIQALQCNRNTCPTEITTHNRRLQRGLNPVDKAERIRRYAENMHREAGVIAHAVCPSRAGRAALTVES